LTEIPSGRRREAGRMHFYDNQFLKSYIMVFIRKIGF
jgi:hypothetical protein